MGKKEKKKKQKLITQLLLIKLNIQQKQNVQFMMIFFPNEHDTKHETKRNKKLIVKTCNTFCAFSIFYLVEEIKKSKRESNVVTK